MLLHLYVPFLLTTFAYGFVTQRPFDVLRNMMKLEKARTNGNDFNGFVTRRSFDVLRDPMKLEKSRTNGNDFNGLNDVEGIFQRDLTADGRIIKNKNLQINKKMDFKPKYDPGWKFIGLGKRPRQNEIVYGYEKPYNPISPNDSDFYNEDYYQYKDSKINPLLTISTLMNFEIFNAIRDGIAEAARDIKKGDVKPSQHFSGMNSGNNRFTGRSFYVGRQNGMYDPGWMLTGLGK